MTNMMHSYNEALHKYGPLIARILLSALFIISGFGKLMAFSGTALYIASVGIPAGNLVALIAIIIEIGGGLLLLIGWRGRLAAWVLLVYTLLATAIFHNNIVDQNQMIQALKNLSIMGGMLMVALHGTGAHSIVCKCGGKYCIDCKSCEKCKDGKCDVHTK